MLWACRRLIIYLCIFVAGLSAVVLYKHGYMSCKVAVYLFLDGFMLGYWIKHPIEKGK